MYLTKVQYGVLRPSGAAWKTFRIEILGNGVCEMEGVKAARPLIPAICARLQTRNTPKDTNGLGVDLRHGSAWGG